MQSRYNKLLQYIHVVYKYFPYIWASQQSTAEKYGLRGKAIVMVTNKTVTEPD